MHQRGLRWTFLGLFLVTGSVAAFFGVQPGFKSYHSEPDAVREWAADEWDRHMSTTTEPLYSVEAFFSDALIDQRSEAIGVRSGYEVMAWPYLDTEDPLVEIESIGVTVPEPTESEDANYYVTRNYYAPDTLEQLVITEHENLTNRDKARTNGMWPSLSLMFHKKGPSTVTGCRILDGRTHVPMTWGILWSNGPDSAHTFSQITTWRRTGLIASVTYLAGERPFYDFVPDLGASLSQGPTTVKVLHIADDLSIAEKPRRTGNSDLPYNWCRAGEPEGSKDRRTGYFIAAYPYGHKSALQFRAFREDGKKINVKAFTLTQLGYVVMCKAEPGEVARMEVSFPEGYERATFELPPLPMLPEENDHLDDLFEMKIPYARIKMREIGRVTEQMAQLRSNLYWAETKKGGEHDPNQYLQAENLTARDLLELHSQQVVPGTIYDYDPTTHELEVKRPTQEPWWERIWPF